MQRHDRHHHADRCECYRQRQLAEQSPPQREQQRPEDRIQDATDQHRPGSPRPRQQSRDDDDEGNQGRDPDPPAAQRVAERNRIGCKTRRIIRCRSFTAPGRGSESLASGRCPGPVLPSPTAPAGPPGRRGRTLTVRSWPGPARSPRPPRAPARTGAESVDLGLERVGGCSGGCGLRLGTTYPFPEIGVLDRQALAFRALFGQRREQEVQHPRGGCWRLRGGCLAGL